MMIDKDQRCPSCGAGQFVHMIPSSRASWEEYMSFLCGTVLCEGKIEEGILCLRPQLIANTCDSHDREQRLEQELLAAQNNCSDKDEKIGLLDKELAFYKNRCPMCYKPTVVETDCPIDGPNEGAFCTECNWTHMDASPKNQIDWYRDEGIKKDKKIKELEELNGVLARAGNSVQREREELRKSCTKNEHEIEQILGKALGYPELYPVVSKIDDGTVCVGDHVAVTIAQEAADKIVKQREYIKERDSFVEALAEAEVTRFTREMH